VEDVKWKSEFYSRRAEEIGLIGQAGYIDSGQKHWNKWEGGICGDYYQQRM